MHFERLDEASGAGDRSVEITQEMIDRAVAVLKSWTAGNEYETDDVHARLIASDMLSAAWSESHQSS